MNLEFIYNDEAFVDLFDARGKPAETPCLLIVLQFIEDLSDVEAVAALQERISWKYLFGLATLNLCLTLQF